ncbi:hypothetical protein HOY82DRAFT_624664, partial [Tuber indicum]
MCVLLRVGNKAPNEVKGPEISSKVATGIPEQHGIIGGKWFSNPSLVTDRPVFEKLEARTNIQTGTRKKKLTQRTHAYQISLPNLKKKKKIAQISTDGAILPEITLLRKTPRGMMVKESKPPDLMALANAPGEELRTMDFTWLPLALPSYRIHRALENFPMGSIKPRCLERLFNQSAENNQADSTDWKVYGYDHHKTNTETPQIPRLSSKVR